MPDSYTQGLLNEAMAKLKPGRSRVPTAQKSVITENIHGSVTARAGSIIREHAHAQAVPEEGAVVEATQGLLQAWNWSD